MSQLKTPISVLNELLTKLGKTVKYEEVDCSEDGLESRMFKVRVTVDNESGEVCLHFHSRTQLY